MLDLSQWQPRPKPTRLTFNGQYCRVEAMQAQHADDLFEASTAPGVEQRYRYLTIEPQSRGEFDTWLQTAIAGHDPLYYAVIDQRTGKCEGRQSLMRIEPAHGVIEIGNILWGPTITRTRVATEALYLMAEYVFDQLGYRRFEWKCDTLNEPSRAAALRFGFKFEGIFHQHLIIKGKNRDTAWYAMLDHQWPRLKQAYQAWLSPENFDASGTQVRKLQDFFDDNSKG